MGTVLVAPRQALLEGPVVFLAGPTWGRTPWQELATQRLLRLEPRLHVANPRRPVDVNRDFDEQQYNEQVDWETQYLRRAGDCGVVMFWLACEDVHRCERPHAQTTRLELGEWMERARRGDGRLVVGIEEGFSGARYIRRRLSENGPRITVGTSLDETCGLAVVACRGGVTVA